MDEAASGSQRTPITRRTRWAAAAVGCVACTVSTAAIVSVALGSTATAVGAGMTYLVPLILGLGFGAWILRGAR